MAERLDLKQLSVDRDGKAAAPRPRLARKLTRVVLPLTILLGFLTLIGAAAGRRWMPTREVTVVSVLSEKAERQVADQPLFQAPGWVEPMPTPVNVPALAAGVVERLHVVEGQIIKRGETIAELISVDAELAVRRAQATLEKRQGELERAIAERDAAQIRVDQPVHLEVVLADAESQLAASQLERDRLPQRIDAAAAELAFTRQSVAGKRAAGAGVSGVVRQRAEADLKDAQANLDELRSQPPHLEAKTDALQRKVDALQTQLDLLVEERRALAEAKANVAAATALRDQAQVQLEQAELQLDRMIIRSPIDGRVLKLVSSPGDRVMGLDTTAEHRSSTVVQLYDPDSLQVRVDVRLEDVPLVVPGQPVELTTAASSSTFKGQVLRSTSRANIQKNTLEAKVALLDPPPEVAPEMLVTATFLSKETEDSGQQDRLVRRTLVPEELIQQDAGGHFVWTVDSQQLLQRASVQLGVLAEGGLREITEGIELTEKLVAQPKSDFTPGEAVTVTGDDLRLGVQ